VLVEQLVETAARALEERQRRLAAVGDGLQVMDLGRAPLVPQQLAAAGHQHQAELLVWVASRVGPRGDEERVA
jgi:hypothetical protein